MAPGLVFAFFVLPAVVALLIGRRKGYQWRGLFAGLVFSWLGVLAIALWQPTDEELTRRKQADQAAAQRART